MVIGVLAPYRGQVPRQPRASAAGSIENRAHFGQDNTRLENADRQRSREQAFRKGRIEN
jgi:hypothetical protein